MPNPDSPIPDRVDMLVDRVPPELRARIAAVRQVLTDHGPAVADAMRQLGQLSAELDVALNMPASLDPAETSPLSDQDLDAVWARLGWWDPWKIADHVRDSHPDHAAGLPGLTDPN